MSKQLGKGPLPEIIKIVVPKDAKLFIEEITRAFSIFEQMNIDSDDTKEIALNNIHFFNEFKLLWQNSKEKYPELNAPQYEDYISQIIRTLLLRQFNNNDISNEEKYYYAKLMQEALNDIQYVLIGDNFEAETEIPILKRMELKYAPTLENNIINSESLYYWPHAPEKLDLLYRLLLEAEIIAETSAFRLPFSVEKPNKQNKIQWLKSQPSLFYMLYKIYDNSLTFKKESIAAISMKLFTNKDSEYIRKLTIDHFNRVAKKFSDENYTEKKHSEIIDIIEQLTLKKIVPKHPSKHP